MKLIKFVLFGYFHPLFVNFISCAQWNYSTKIKPIESITNVLSKVQQEELKTAQNSIMHMDEVDEPNRFRICAKTTRVINFLENRKVKFLRNVKVGEVTNYAIHGIQDQGLKELKIERAFACPTEPTIYIQILPDTDEYSYGSDGENDDKLIVFIKQSDLAPVCSVQNHDIKIVETIVDVDALDNRAYENIHFPPVDLNNISEKGRLQMCKRALAVDVPTMWNVKLMDEGVPGPALFYGVNLKTNPATSEMILAFQCPTYPPIYLHVYKQSRSMFGLRIRDLLNAFIVIEEEELRKVFRRHH